MKGMLPFLCAATVFVLGVVAIGDHSALIRQGYRLSGLERERDHLQVEAARARDRVSRLSSPALLAERAREFGLATEYPREFPVVRFGGPERAEVLAQAFEPTR